MLDTVFATKVGMSQAWTSAGKRVAVTRCRVDNNLVLASHTPQTPSPSQPQNSQDSNKYLTFEIGFGTKRLKNMKKPLRSKLEKGGFSVGVRKIEGVRLEVQAEGEGLKVGDTIKADQILSVGDVVKVQGTSKGRGFAGGIKRHGFHGGPKTHGQSDRERAVGSIGAGTSPGKVWKGKKMPGHYGVDKQTVTGLVVLHVDPETQEVWLSGPVPGFMTSLVRIIKTGKTRQIELDKAASGIPEVEVKAEAEAEVETQEEAKAESK